MGIYKYHMLRGSVINWRRWRQKKKKKKRIFKKYPKAVGKDH